MENTNENVNVVNTEKTIIKEVQVPVEVIKEIEVDKVIVKEIPSKVGKITSTSISEALANFNLEMENISKNSENPFYKSSYLDLGGISKVIRPILAKNDISVIQYPINDSEGRVSVNTILLHRNGDSIEFPGVFIRPSKAGDAQAVAALVTYMKRMSISAILFIASDDSTEDDDGNLASGKVATPQITPTQTTTTKPTGRIGRI